MGSGGISFVNRAGNSTRPYFPNSTPIENTHRALFTCYTVVKSALADHTRGCDGHGEKASKFAAEVDAMTATLNRLIKPPSGLPEHAEKRETASRRSWQRPKPY